MRKTETDMKNANILQIVLIIALVIGLLTGLYMLAGCTVFKGDTDDKTAKLEFDSFDGGGPEYKALIEDASIAEISEEKEYKKSDHDKINGAGYKVIYTITGKKPGKTRLIVSCTTQKDIVSDKVYEVTVAEDNKVTVKSIQD